MPFPDETDTANGPRVSLVTEYELDNEGRVLAEHTNGGPLGPTDVTSSYNYYDLSNQVVSSVDAESNETKIFYDAAGRQTSVTDALLNSSLTVYDELGRVVMTRAADPDGGGDQIAPVSKFEYDSAGRLVSQTDPRGVPTTFQYDSLGRQRKSSTFQGDSVGDPTGQTVESLSQYDKNGSLIASVDALMRQTDYQVDALGRVTRVTLPDPDGSGVDNPLTRPQTDTYYDGFGNVARIEELRGSGIVEGYYSGDLTYSENMFGGQPDPGEFTVTGTYFSAAVGAGNVSVTPLRGGVAAADNATGKGFLLYSVQNVHNRFEPGTIYHTNSNHIIAVRLHGRQWQYTNRDANDWIDFTLQEGDRLLAKVDFTADDVESLGGKSSTLGEGDQRTTEFEYDKRNRPILDNILGGAIDGSDLITTSQYDAVGNLEITTEPTGVLDPTTGSTDVVTKTIYDGLNLVTESIVNYEIGESLTNNPDLVHTVWTYDTRGNVETVKTASDPRDIVSSFSGYDKLGRLVEQHADYDPSTGQASSTTFVYDAVGNLVDQTLSGTGIVDRTTSYLYDHLYRQSHVITPDPESGAGLDRDKDPEFSGDDRPFNRFVYDVGSNLIETVNAEGESSQSAYDTLGQVISTWDGNEHQTQYTYDEVGNLRTVEDAESNVTTYFYDDLNRQIRETHLVTNANPNGESRQTIYDDQGNVWKTIDREGRERKFEYDLLDRIEFEYWDGAVQFEWKYDDASRVVYQRDGSEIQGFGYDNLGRLNYQANYDPSNGVPGDSSVIHAYDYQYEPYSANGGTEYHDQVVIQQYLGNDFLGETTYRYDRQGRLSETSDKTRPTGPSKNLQFSYNGDDTLDQIDRTFVLPSVDVPTDFEYDAAGRLKTIEHLADSVFSHDYSYDNANRVSNFDSLGGSQIDRGFAYDDAGQLTNDNGLDYTYDENGNRATNPDATVVTDAANRIIDDGTYYYGYDKEGNLTSRTHLVTGQTRKFEWDLRNRLTRVTEHAQPSATGTVATLYRYNASDQLTRTIAGVANETFVYEGGQVALTFSQTHGGSRRLTHRYLYGPTTDQALVDEVFAYQPSSGLNLSDEILWLLGDHQNSVRQIVDTDGNLRKNVEYDSFGNITDEDYYDQTGALVTSSSADAIDQSLYYTGRPWDDNSETYDYRARRYDPNTGRFLSEDPLGLGPDPNAYRYVSNSPLNFVDPSGLTQAGNPITSLFNIGRSPASFAGGNVSSSSSGIPYNSPSSSSGNAVNSIGNLDFTGGSQSLLNFSADESASLTRGKLLSDASTGSGGFSDAQIQSLLNPSFTATEIGSSLFDFFVTAPAGYVGDGIRSGTGQFSNTIEDAGISSGNKYVAGTASAFAYGTNLAGNIIGGVVDTPGSINAFSQGIAADYELAGGISDSGIERVVNTFHFQSGLIAIPELLYGYNIREDRPLYQEEYNGRFSEASTGIGTFFGTFAGAGVLRTKLAPKSVTEFAGRTGGDFVPDLSHVTGKTAVSRNRAIQAVINGE